MMCVGRKHNMIDRDDVCRSKSRKHMILHTYRAVLIHNPSKADECPPDVSKMKVNRLDVTFLDTPFGRIMIKGRRIGPC